MSYQTSLEERERQIKRNKVWICYLSNSKLWKFRCTTAQQSIFIPVIYRGTKFSSHTDKNRIIDIQNSYWVFDFFLLLFYSESNAMWLSGFSLSPSKHETDSSHLFLWQMERKWEYALQSDNAACTFSIDFYIGKHPT